LQRQHWKTHGFGTAKEFQDAFHLPYLTAPSLRKQFSESKAGKPFSDERLAKLNLTDQKGKGKGVSGKWVRTPEMREQMSAIAVAKMLEDPSAFHKGFKSEWVLSEKADQMVYVRSSWERRVLWVLDQYDEVEEVAVEPFALPYTFDGHTHNYIPDLLVTFEGGVQELWEIKPYKLLRYPQTQAKIEALHRHAHEHGMNSRVVTLADIESMERKTSVWVENGYRAI